MEFSCQSAGYLGSHTFLKDAKAIDHDDDWISISKIIDCMFISHMNNGWSVIIAETDRPIIH